MGISLKSHSLMEAAQDSSYVQVPHGYDLMSNFAIQNLPVLTTHNVVSGLNRRQLREYHQHYYPDAPVPWELIACKAAICKAIECKGINTIDWE